MYEQGEIVMIPVPFSDLAASKKRPVLVVSNDAYNAESQDMIVAAITSNLTQKGVRITNSDMVSGELPKPSVIRADKIYTLDQGIAAKRIGKISVAVQNSVRKAINRLVELP
jgi:mRNA interferase MazF